MLKKLTDPVDTVAMPEPDGAPTARSHERAMSIVDVMIGLLLVSIVGAVLGTAMLESMQSSSNSSLRTRQTAAFEAVWERLQTDGSWVRQGACATSGCLIDPDFFATALAQQRGGELFTAEVTAVPRSRPATVWNVRATIRLRVQPRGGKPIPPLVVAGLYDPTKGNSLSQLEVADDDDPVSAHSAIVQFSAAAWPGRHQLLARSVPTARILDETPALRTVLLDAPQGDGAAIRSALAATPGISAALQDVVVDAPYVITEPVDTRPPSWLNLLNDTDARLMWHLERIGAPRAWMREGLIKRPVTVAVLDSYVNADHPDLAGRVTIGVDANKEGLDTGDSHGTQTAGTIAASANNGYGIAGIAPTANILSIRTCEHYQTPDGPSERPGCHFSAVLEGMVAAADAGANVIEIANSMPLVTDGHIRLVQTAARYAVDRGAVLVCPAHNQNDSTPRYPGALPECLAVAATDRNDQKASFSNFGDWIDIAAPGTEGRSLDDSATGTGSWSGTSMAGPHVAGLAALMYQYGWEPADIPGRIMGTARDLGAPGRDAIFGAGLIDVDAALSDEPTARVPLRRMWRKETAGYYHHYSAPHLANAARLGYRDDGLLGYVYATQVFGTVPLHEHYRPRDRHHRLALKAHIPNDDWRYRGIVGYIPRAVVPEMIRIDKMYVPLPRKHAWFHPTERRKICERYACKDPTRILQGQMHFFTVPVSTVDARPDPI